MVWHHCQLTHVCPLFFSPGILHAQERDYKTGYSYFYESFEVRVSATVLATDILQAGQPSLCFDTQDKWHNPPPPPPRHQSSIAQGYDSVESKLPAVRSLKYMLLMKILMNEASDVPNIVTGKLALKYAGRYWGRFLPQGHALYFQTSTSCHTRPRPRARGHAGCGERQLGPVSRRL